MSKPLFSVIIPCLNEEKYIGEILTNLKNQTIKNFEVLVVDAHSSDKTVNVIKKFSNDFPVKVIESNIKNLSHQRNLGAKKAAGEYLFFIDADNRIPNDFLKKTESLLEKRNCDLVIPHLVPDVKTLFNRFSYSLSSILVRISLHTPRPFSTGGNFIIKKSFFQKTAGFSEEVFVGEDHDIVRQIKELKGKIEILDTTHVIFSMRRFEHEGFSTYIKYAYAFFYQIFFRRVKKPIYRYKMGGHNYE